MLALQSTVTCAFLAALSADVLIMGLVCAGSQRTLDVHLCDGHANHRPCIESQLSEAEMVGESPCMVSWDGSHQLIGRPPFADGKARTGQWEGPQGEGKQACRGSTVKLRCLALGLWCVQQLLVGWIASHTGQAGCLVWFFE